MAPNSASISSNTTLRPRPRIDDATRLAQIQIADLNGRAPDLRAPDSSEVPFNSATRF
ncbi:hypothetical protein D554_1644 [Bordetella holmesii 30539]|uniref:N-acetyltransferase YedL n=2 Tax=Bordetella holmesii TaxID=35814 RepID=A0ABN0RUK1_9BORD|nr:hypothetical protein D556_2191 [Bordetella holmesii 41130]EXF88824.1 hypothetical protein D554_1644 [Bordetella holmesii 30539]EXX92906.1 hypothetical protein D559_0293 [Bordetella holmesii 1058]KAK81476.1 hypothetical protein L496_0038 [Bordetella holmesii CDC-H572-BH]KAK81654.1 hypothetical protein L573_2098 [Bordetella holmesii H620]KAK85052.1 hypothetical protein L503_0039 [Bordetella holmesii CDC-H809-BH]KAK88683.1 hypothetical protein L497_0041 [Bordetella holmesii CDC-H585-BH]KAK89